MTEPDGSPGGTTVKSDQRLLRIVRGLEELGGAGVTELADHVEFPKSTVHNHLTTLHQAEFVTKDAGEYHLGLRFLELGELARQRRTRTDQIRQKVTEIAEQTQERAQFIVEEHGRGVYVHRFTGEKAVSTDSRLGRHVSIHASSAGKAILAHLPEERVDWIAETKGLERLTENTITDPAELKEELSLIRERGYATNDEENVVGLRAVGAPILGADDDVVGAISVSAPTHRLTGDLYESEFPDLVRGATNEIELNITFS